jgi:hypothetical protein
MVLELDQHWDWYPPCGAHIAAQQHRKPFTDALPGLRNCTAGFSRRHCQRCGIALLGLSQQHCHCCAAAEATDTQTTLSVAASFHMLPAGSSLQHQLRRFLFGEGVEECTGHCAHDVSPQGKSYRCLTQVSCSLLADGPPCRMRQR